MNAQLDKKKPRSPLGFPTRLILLLAISGAACGIFGGIWFGGAGSALDPGPSATVPVMVPLEEAATPTPEPTPTPYDYAQPVPESDPVEDAWFQDAVFVGDSRTDGLRLYGGVAEGDFICYKGLTSFEFDSKPCIKSGSGKITALEALKKKEYGKVYLMLGLNELGYSTAEFAKAFETLLDQILLAQPNAVLYVQSVVPINDKKAREQKQGYYITNEKVAEFNAEITRLTQDKKIVFLNVSEGLVDETGELPYDQTADGVHFSRDWYKQWYSYLKTHTVDPENLEAIS